MAGDNLPPNPAEQAALYAAGALPADEAARFERLLADGDEACRVELARLDPVLAALFAATPAVEPGPRVRESLLARAGAVFVQRGDRAAWSDIGVPGIQRRVLFRDTRRNLVTFLLRLAPGAVLPPHRHTAVEECYVLEGDVQSMGVQLRAGDYFRAEAGSLHRASRTVGGCLLLLQSAADGEGTA